MTNPSHRWEYRLTFTEAHYLEHFRHHRRAARRSWILKWLGIPLLALMVLESGSSLVSESASHDTLDLPALYRFLLFASLAFFLWRAVPIEEKRLRKSFTELPGKDGALHMVLSDAGAYVKNAVSESTINWDAYTRARMFGDGVLLSAGVSLTWLPDEGLVAGRREELDEFLRARIADSAHVKRR